MKTRIWYSWSVLVVLVVLVGCRKDPYAEEAFEFRSAFEAFFAGMNEAYLTKNIEAASETSTGEMLERIESDLQVTGGTLNEIYIITVQVESMTDTEASTAIEYRYRSYTIDASGQKITDENWNYHTAKVMFQYENGTWKVDDMETIDWTR